MQTENYLERLCDEWSRTPEHRLDELHERWTTTLHFFALDIVDTVPEAQKIWSLSDLIYIRSQLAALMEFFRTRSGQIRKEGFDRVAALVQQLPSEIIHKDDSSTKLFSSLLGLQIFIRRLTQRIRPTENKKACNRFITLHPELLEHFIHYGEDSLRIKDGIGDIERETAQRHAGIFPRNTEIWDIILPRFASAQLLSLIRRRVRTRGVRNILGYTPEEEFVDENPDLVSDLLDSMQKGVLFEVKIPAKLSGRLVRQFLQEKASALIAK